MTAALTLAREQAAPSNALVFLTQGRLREHHDDARADEALDRVGMAKNCSVIDADTLADADARRGYGTPTVLYDDRDLFGMPEPTPPLPSPT